MTLGQFPENFKVLFCFYKFHQLCLFQWREDMLGTLCYHFGNDPYPQRELVFTPKAKVLGTKNFLTKAIE